MSFKVGDKVTAVAQASLSGPAGPDFISTVALVDKTVHLEDGTEWTLEGRWLTSKGEALSLATIRLTEPGDEERVERRRLLESIRRFKKWDKLSLNSLRIVEAELVVEEV